MTFPANHAVGDPGHTDAHNAIEAELNALPDRYAAVGSAASAVAPSVPNLLTALRTQNDAAPVTRRIIGLGSSVGVGATLPNAATQTPSAYFTSRLNATVNRLGNVPFVLTNGSVNGSIVSEGYSAHYAAAKVTAGGNPTVLLLTYGMNDGAVAQYHAGQTYPFVYTRVTQLIAAARADGGDPVVMTTPHPHSTRNTYTLPGGVTPTYSDGVPAYTYAASVVMADWAGTGALIPASYRHLRVNQAMRQAAIDSGAAVIDAERYWFKAVAKYGEDALFNTGEFVHPNLLGHQESYWRAIDDFMASLDRATVSSGTTVPASAATEIVVRRVDNSTYTSTTRATDNALQFTAPASSVWEFDVDVFYTVPTANDLSISVAAPSGASGRFGAVGIANTATGLTGEATGRSALINGGFFSVGGNTSDSYVRIRGVAVVGATGGTVGLQFGLVATAGTATIYADSVIRARRLS